jgi:hypothetical protein
MTLARDDRTALEAALLDLDGGWTVLADIRLGAAAADYLVLHARRGIALVDPAAQPDDPVAAARAFLESEAFFRFFPGELPIVHVALTPEGARELGRRLDDALATLPPLTIADAEWPDAVAALARAKPARARWLGAPAIATARPEADAEEADFAAAASADDAAPAPAAEPWRDLAPRMPRWQTVAAFASLILFGLAFLSLPVDAPKRHPALEVAIAPPAPHFAAAPLPAPPHLPLVAGRAPPFSRPGPVALAPSAPPEVRLADAPAPDAPPLPSVALAAPPPPQAEAKAQPPRQAHAQRALATMALPPPSAAPAAQPVQPVQPIVNLIHRSCRTFSARTSVLGSAGEVRGFACQASDGTWEIMSETPAPLR